MVSSISTAYMFVILSLSFSYLTIFCKATDVQNTGHAQLLQIYYYELHSTIGH